MSNSDSESDTYGASISRRSSIERRIIEAAMTFHQTTSCASAQMLAENSLDEACAELAALLAGKELPEISLPKAPKGGWMYAESSDAEDWSGVLETKDLAIQEARVELPRRFGVEAADAKDLPLYVARGEPMAYDDLNRYLNPDSVLASLNDSLAESLAPVILGDGWQELEFVNALAARAGLEAWARQHIKLPSWCIVQSNSIERIDPDPKEP